MFRHVTIYSRFGGSTSATCVQLLSYLSFKQLNRKDLEQDSHKTGFEPCTSRCYCAVIPYIICLLTLFLLTWRIWWAPNNASRWQMGFNWVFKELTDLWTVTSGIWLPMVLSNSQKYAFPKRKWNWRTGGTGIQWYWYTVGSNGGTLHLQAKIKVSSDNTPCHNVKR